MSLQALSDRKPRSLPRAYIEFGECRKKGQAQRRSSRSEATYRGQVGGPQRRSLGFDTLTLLNRRSLPQHLHVPFAPGGLRLLKRQFSRG